VNLTATIVVKGDPALLREYRRGVNERLEEEGAGAYRERHVDAQLEYEFRLKGGIPFPPFVESSRDFPDLSIEVDWSDAATGRSGRAIIQNGVLREQSAQVHAAGTALQDVRAGADGRLQLALACAPWRDAWLGYAIATGQHAFFRVSGSGESCELRASDGVEAEWAERWIADAGGTQYTELVPSEPIAADELRELDRLAKGFTGEWIWFDESPPEETAVERTRFQAYGYPVVAANLRSEKLRKVLEPAADGFAFATFGEASRWIPGLLRRVWLREVS
jgi:hypothetical protein